MSKYVIVILDFCAAKVQRKKDMRWTSANSRNFYKTKRDNAAYFSTTSCNRSHTTTMAHVSSSQ